MTLTAPHLALRTLAAASLGCLLLSGCRINEHKDGKNENVDISTPFGSMKVNTDKSADTSAIGLTAYPGAVPAKNDHGSDDDAANVNMSFGSFHLGVKAASFQTPDAPEKVIAFYRKDMAHYGDVITCKGNSVVGTPARTSQGLTCDSKHSKTSVTTDTTGGLHINSSESSNNIELRAGSQQHQHIVGIEPKDGGTKIGLVLLDLPSHLSDHNDKDSE